jgi:peptide/nickel transport system substrate-binding protein
VAIDPNATIRVGGLTAQASLDPVTLSRGTNVNFNVWDRLTTVDAHGNIIPMIAKSWAAAKDGKSITFKLRTDAKFHDGTPVDATAVKASLDRAVNFPGSAVASFLQDVDSVDVLNPSTVRINLKFGGAELPALLSTDAGAIINPKCIANNTNLTLSPPECSSGGMVLDHANPPNEWYLKKPTSGPAYWDPKAFRYQELDIFSVPNTQTGINAVRSGDLDAYQITPDGLAQAKQLVASGELAGKPHLTPGMYALFLNPRKPPFDNILLRQAVQAAIDDTPITHDYFAANCDPSQQPVLATSFAYDRKWNPNPYNPDRAKQLLAQAGVPNGFTFTLTTVPQSALLAITQITQDQLAKVGIKAQIKLVPTGSDISLRSLDPNISAQAAVAAWGPGPDPAIPATELSSINESRLAASLGSNVSDQVLTLRYHALDPRLTITQRGAVYQSLWKMVYKNALIYNYCLLGQMRLHRKNILNADFPPFEALTFGMDSRYLLKTK